MTELRSRRGRLASVTAVGLAGALAAGGLALLGGASGTASSHREAPQILGDPQADSTDTYAFVSPDKKNTVTLAASWFPFQEPNGGPNFYPFAEDARYNINVDNDGDGEADIIYRWEFENLDERGDDTFLYNNDVVKSLKDKNLLFSQQYTLTEVTEDGERTLIEDAIAAPSFTGKASMPNYDKLRKQAIKKFEEGRGKAYAGAADDSFFLDLRIFDLLYGGDLSERGQDTLTGYNVNHLAVQVPMSAVALNGDEDDNPVIGVWNTTERKSISIGVEGDNDDNGDENENNGDSNDTANGLECNVPVIGDLLGDCSDEFVAASKAGKNIEIDEGWTQVSRLGNPLINEVISAAAMKDEFNRTEPAGDADIDGLVERVLDPEVPKLLKKIYGLKVPKGERGDLFEIFLTGIANDNDGPLKLGNLNWHGLNKDVDPEELVPSEMLRLNMAVPVTKNPSRLGVLGGDLQGFPNGRRYVDDVLDIEIQALAGAVKNKKVKIVDALAAGDKVNSNNKKFTRKFPYIAAPNEKGVNRY